MLTIEIELLGGRYSATAHSDRSRAEWPPHLARFFSALVAALHDHDPVDDSERKALLWLENQGAPQMDVDLTVDDSAGRRDVRSVFVPVNDITLGDDPDHESGLRAAQAKLQDLETRPQGSGNALTKAREAVEKARERLRSPQNADLDRAIALLPHRRTRQERTFPVVIPARKSFAFLWPDAELSEHSAALDRLCDRVTRLGHSSSLVRCAVVTREIIPTLIPRSGGEYVLRTVGPGQLDRLEAEYKRHQAVEPRVLPSRPQRYGEPIERSLELPSSIFSDDWLVFERIGGDRPLGSRGGDLAVALRRAIIETNGIEDLPESLAGRERNGGPAHEPHLAFVPLPWVGQDHADGSIQGLAIIAPRSMPADDQERLMQLLARWEAERGDPRDDYALDLGTPTEFGRAIKLRLRRVEAPTKKTLSSARWCRPSRRFITVTPIALDRHPGNLRSNSGGSAYRAAREAESSIADACERIGLPRPAEVSISLAPLIPGAENVDRFAPWPRQKDRVRRARVHAYIAFAEKVRGPVLIGAGRHFGLGLCLPVSSGPPEQSAEK